MQNVALTKSCFTLGQRWGLRLDCQLGLSLKLTKQPGSYGTGFTSAGLPETVFMLADAFYMFTFPRQ